MTRIEEQRRRGLLASLALTGSLTAAVAALGARTTAGGSDPWYRDLDKPSFTPPDWIFGPVWTALYTLAAISGARVLRAEPSRARSAAIALWLAQLGLNGAWTELFFGRHRPRVALADAAALLASIGAYAAAARKVDRPAAWLVVPYGAWVAFAVVLNASFVLRNPEA